MQSTLNFVDKCVTDVFGTMIGLSARPGTGEESASLPVTLTGVTGSVSLTGKFTGIVYTSFPETLAALVAQRILGGDQPDQSSVDDVIGELTNMITGNLKSHMADRGYNCQLSIPTVLRGSPVHVCAHDAHVRLKNTYQFNEVGETLTVQVFARMESQP